MYNNRRFVLACGVSLAAVAAAFGAQAQTQAPDGAVSQSLAAASSTAAQLGEVVVTARRHAENAQTVPIAIDVISQQTLKQNNINTIGDLQQIVPSLTINTSLSRDALDVSIRGQGSNGISGLPGVLAYLNEVPLPVDRAGNISGGGGLLFDLENIQVLKGPQGTLFGRNTLGGALLLQTARPNDAYSGALQLGYGNYNDREVDGYVNIPLIEDKLLARVAFNGQWRDGFTHIESEPDHPNGIDADGRDNYSVRTSLSFRPVAAFQNDTIVTVSKFNSDGSPGLLSAYNPMSPAAGAFPGLGAMYAQQQALGARTAIPIDVTDRSAGTLFEFSNTSRLDLGHGLTFRNIVGYDITRTTYEFDLDTTSLPIIENPTNPSRRTVDQFTEEAQLLGKLFSDRLDWIVGVFYLDQPNPSSYVPNAIIAFGAPSDIEYKQSASSEAIFGQGTYDLSAFVPKLKFTAGLRYTWDNNTYSQLGGDFGSSCVYAPIVDCTAIPSNKSKDSALTWTLGLDYQLNRDTLVYIASRRGYREGASNIQQFPGINPLFGPEFVTDGEIGLKSDWKVGGIPIRTNADFYYQKYKDIQVSESIVVPSQPNPVAITANAAAATLMGAELETTAKLTHDLQVGATFDYLDFKYDDFGPDVDISQLKANVTTGRPRFKYGFNARYHLPLDPAIGGLSVGAVYNWQAKNGDTSQPGGVIGSYGLLNLSADWNEIYGRPIDLSLFASNVTNKTYGVGTFVGYYQVGYSTLTYGEPRMYGVRAKYHF